MADKNNHKTEKPAAKLPAPIPVYEPTWPVVNEIMIQKKLSYAEAKAFLMYPPELKE